MLLSMVIADDEQLIREGIQSLPWHTVGVRVAGAADSVEQALALIRREKPQIVLSDIKMKGPSGLELTEILGREFQHTKVILITGYRQFDYAVEAIRLGVFGFVAKPTSPEELLAIVRRARKSILYEYSRRAEDEQTEDPLALKKSVRDALDYIQQHYAEELSLTDIARHVHVVPNHLSRLFRETLDNTVTSVLTEVRLRKACELLKNPDLTVGEVAGRVGIPDARYFGQLFKKAYNLTPKEMRTKMFWQG